MRIAAGNETDQQFRFLLIRQSIDPVLDLSPGRIRGRLAGAGLGGDREKIRVQPHEVRESP